MLDTFALRNDFGIFLVPEVLLSKLVLGEQSRVGVVLPHVDTLGGLERLYVLAILLDHGVVFAVVG